MRPGSLVMVDIEVKDQVRYATYKEMAAPTVAQYGGRYIVRGGKVEQMEGEWKTNRFVVVEFPSVERAKELLVYDELTLGEIAYRLGYSSAQHLSTQFRKITGLTPSHFKRIGAARRHSLDQV